MTGAKAEDLSRLRVERAAEALVQSGFDLSWNQRLRPRDRVMARDLGHHPR